MWMNLICIDKLNYINYIEWLDKYRHSITYDFHEVVMWWMFVSCTCMLMYICYYWFSYFSSISVYFHKYQSVSLCKFPYEFKYIEWIKKWVEMIYTHIYYGWNDKCWTHCRQEKLVRVEMIDPNQFQMLVKSEFPNLTTWTRIDN